MANKYLLLKFLQFLLESMSGSFQFLLSTFHKSQESFLIELLVPGLLWYLYYK